MRKFSLARIFGQFCGAAAASLGHKESMRRKVRAELRRLGDMLEGDYKRAIATKDWAKRKYLMNSYFQDAQVLARLSSRMESELEQVYQELFG